jgi:uncharacterized membrane protein YidH (DUF202 family)
VTAANGQPGANGEPSANGEPGADQHSADQHSADQPSADQPSADQPSAGTPAAQPGLAQERTALAWTRTAISFAAVGGVVLKRDLIPGLILLAVAPAIWQLGRLAYRDQKKLILLTATIVGVAVIAVVISFT